MNNENLRMIDLIIATAFYTNMEYYTYSMLENEKQAESTAEIISLLKQINEKLEKLVD